MPKVKTSLKSCHQFCLVSCLEHTMLLSDHFPDHTTVWFGVLQSHRKTDRPLGMTHMIFHPDLTCPLIHRKKRSEIMQSKHRVTWEITRSLCNVRVSNGHSTTTSFTNYYVVPSLENKWKKEQVWVRHGLVHTGSTVCLFNRGVFLLPTYTLLGSG